MKLLITANITPFLHGGADAHIEGLATALRAHGHQVELIRFPFTFAPEASIEALMAHCEQLDFERPNGQAIDRVISLQFPGYGVRHPEHVVWIMHQHRAVYELYATQNHTPAMQALKEKIHAYDRRVLERARARFANSRRVAERLVEYNGLAATPLYHPPALAGEFRCAPAEPYVFYPSRLESLKRQDLLIEALARAPSGLPVLIAGEGGQRDRYRALVERLGLGDRVRFLGRISDAEKIAFYAHASAVFFGPFDEDYGYITLEAMLSGKPVITCTDSGGPLEFVVDGETGWVCPPDPAALADCLAGIAADPARAAAMGRAGRARYDSLQIDWSTVVERLLAA